MKIENLRTEDYLLDPVLKREKDAEIYRAFGEKIDLARIEASETLMSALSVYYSDFEGMEAPDAFFASRNFFAKEGIEGTEKHLAGISDWLHRESLKVRLGIF